MRFRKLSLIFTASACIMAAGTAVHAEEILAGSRSFQDLTIVNNDDFSMEVSCDDQDPGDGYTWNVHFENKSKNSDFAVSLMNTALSGVMCETDEWELSGWTIKAGGNKDAIVTWPVENIRFAQIDGVDTVSFELKVYRNNHFQEDDAMCVDDRFTVIMEDTEGTEELTEEAETVSETETEDTEETEMTEELSEETGERILLDNEMFKAVLLSNGEDSEGLPVWHMLLENHTDNTVMFELDNSVINEWVITPYWTQVVLPGAKAYSDISWWNIDVDPELVKDVETASFDILVWNKQKGWNDTYTGVKEYSVSFGMQEEEQTEEGPEEESALSEMNSEEPASEEETTEKTETETEPVTVTEETGQETETAAQVTETEAQETAAETETEGQETETAVQETEAGQETETAAQETETEAQETAAEAETEAQETEAGQETETAAQETETETQETAAETEIETQETAAETETEAQETEAGQETETAAQETETETQETAAETETEAQETEAGQETETAAQETETETETAAEEIVFYSADEGKMTLQSIDVDLAGSYGMLGLYLENTGARSLTYAIAGALVDGQDVNLEWNQKMPPSSRKHSTVYVDLSKLENDPEPEKIELSVRVNTGSEIHTEGSYEIDLNTMQLLSQKTQRLTAPEEDQYKDADTIRNLQSALKNAGYNIGEVDGLIGSATRNAIESWRKAQGLPSGNTVDDELLYSLGVADSATYKRVQEYLTQEGYDVGTPDGLTGRRSREAIADYRNKQGLAGEGIDEQLLTAMGILEAQENAASAAAPAGEETEAASEPADQASEPAGETAQTEQAEETAEEGELQAAADQYTDTNTIRNLKAGLREAGYELDQANNEITQSLREAIADFRSKNGLPRSEAIDDELLFALHVADSETYKALQEALNKAGYNCGEPDGLYGRKTREAVESFRKAYRLENGTGIDEELLKALDIRK